MAGVLSVQRAKQALIIFLVAALAFTGAMAVQDSNADAQVPGDIEILLLVAQVDVVCTHRVTGVDRVRASAPLGRVLESIMPSGGESGFQPLDLEDFLGSCSRYETTRVSLSLNGDLILELASEFEE